MTALTPCPSCPWWVDSEGGAAIPGFSIELARGLACTVGDDDGFRTIMACHGSPEGRETSCRGYLAVEGHRNLTVRLEAAFGRIPLAEILDACRDLDLHPSFETMLDALEEAEPPTQGETP